MPTRYLLAGSVVGAALLAFVAWTVLIHPASHSAAGGTLTAGSGLQGHKSGRNKGTDSDRKGKHKGGKEKSKSWGAGSKKGQGQGKGPERYDFATPCSIIAGRPTDHSVCLSVLAHAEFAARIVYGTKAGQLTLSSAEAQLSPVRAAEFELTDLRPDTRYYYAVLAREAEKSVSGTFHTQRPPGASFVFELQGDSHPERLGKQFDPELYRQTLQAAAADQPDFYLTMGDDFGIDRLRAVDKDSISLVYFSQRSFLGLIGSSAALFLVNGNHEQAAAANLDGTVGSPAVIAQNLRNGLFPLPQPDSFYGGDKQQVPHIGHLRDYYCWTWGDALFVVIDPYWHSPVAVDTEFGGEKKAHDLWQNTLGDDQYHWLESTLAASQSRYKFVFAHHVLGTGRGGVELAEQYEWGGHDRHGDDVFKRMRPGWGLPVHDLMARHGVTIFFQGHDHIYARQELDGVIYQTVPQPADPNYALHYEDAYTSGDILPSSGRLRVTVGPQAVKVEYIRSFLPEDCSSAQKDGAVAASYLVN